MTAPAGTTLLRATQSDARSCTVARGVLLSTACAGANRAHSRIANSSFAKAPGQSARPARTGAACSEYRQSEQYTTPSSLPHGFADFSSCHALSLTHTESARLRIRSKTAEVVLYLPEFGLAVPAVQETRTGKPFRDPGETPAGNQAGTARACCTLVQARRSEIYATRIFSQPLHAAPAAPPVRESSPGIGG